jgi:hypothetical protein
MFAVIRDTTMDCASIKPSRGNADAVDDGVVLTIDRSGLMPMSRSLAVAGQEGQFADGKSGRHAT